MKIERTDRKITRAVLHRGLSLARPYGGKNETDYRDFIRSKVCGSSEHKGKLDLFGNLWVEVPQADGTSARTIFTAHLDTVHPADAPLVPTVDRDRMIVHAMPGTPLGADDAAGCAILAGLIVSNVPGMYLFTRGEERGGKGAKVAAKSILPGTYDRAVAFDRRGTGDLCGSQAWDNMASKSFIDALALALGMSHSWADGIYTDNAEFYGIIPEIVNISAGYDHEHTPAETLDMRYFWNLYEAARGLSWGTLPVEGPTARVYDGWGSGRMPVDALPPVSDPSADLDDLARDFCAQTGLQGWESDVIEFLSQAYDLGYSTGFDDGWIDGRASVKVRGKHGKR